MEPELVARQAGLRLQQGLAFVTGLAFRMMVFAIIVCVATFATGWWVFEGNEGWIIVGGIVCAIPIVAGVRAWYMVRRAIKRAASLPAEIRRYTDSGGRDAQVLIDYDTGQPIGGYVRNFGTTGLDIDPKVLPALWASVRALTRVPILAAITILGTLFLGALGTILLLVGLIAS